MTDQEFCDRLIELHLQIGWSCDAIATADFIREVHSTLGLPVPEYSQLQPPDLSDEDEA